MLLCLCFVESSLNQSGKSADVAVAMVFLLGQIRRILNRAADPAADGGTLISNLSVRHTVDIYVH